MSQISNVESRFCVVWEASFPRKYETVSSSKFCFRGFQWNLEICKQLEEHAPWGVQYETVYEILAIRASNQEGTVKDDSLKQFIVTTLLESGSTPPHVLSVETVKSAHKVLWKHPWESPQNCVASKIVCIFHDVPPSELQANRETTSIDFLPDLKNLSLDFSNLWKDKPIADVKLKCGDHTIPAHKAVLAARSPVFAAMFLNKMVESDTGVVDVTDLDAQVLDLLLKYMYSGKVQDLSEDIVPSLYAAGDKYDVCALKMMCSDRMIRSLTEENCVGFLVLADAHSDVPFKDAVTSFICDCDDLLESEVWLQFSGEHPKLAIGVYQRFVTSKRKNKKIIIRVPKKLQKIHQDCS